MVRKFINRYAWRGRAVTLIGASAYAYRELTDEEQDYWNDAISLGGVALATANVMTVGLEAAVIGWAATKVGAGAAVVAPFAAAATLGYVAGATAGTVISEAVFGEGESALDLYTNFKFEPGGILYETADILGNASIIATHYWEEAMSNPYAGGTSNPSHPDYRMSGHGRRYLEAYEAGYKITY